MRPDVLAPEYQAEFAKQLDDAPPVPVEQIKAVIQLQLGKPLAELFKSFDDHRLA
ncbi:MAG: ubiquinone biosynthesis regulatory protein kinase UbiB, partial [Dehalococcoidia bacterium]|nr:ubiquinone biosynthesis regulatory protein kinase UbiB [Dehalococcoidia bacterium]